ncbi:hypothetical protein ERHA54_50290 (plasmid) [Erwinia rhapontici]|nr:hypothetical protein ERHA54_50290 [Erwinia rhapontici]
MKRIIKGDVDLSDLVAASLAIDTHFKKYDEGNKFHYVIYSVSYRSRVYQIEVITRKSTITATVIRGPRPLQRILDFAV